MTDFLLQFVPTLQQLSIPAAVVIVFVILWYSKVLESIGLRIQGRKDSIDNRFNEVNNKTNDGRLRKLEEFQLTQETNHNHDLENLKEWRKTTESRLNRIEEKQDKMAEDISFIKGRMNGNAK